MVRAGTADPLRTFKFTISWDSKVVALVSKMSALKSTTTPVEWREGGASNTSRKLVGRTKYEPVTFEQGLVVASTEFETWVNRVNTLGDFGTANNTGDNATFRQDVTVEVFDVDASSQVKYTLFGAWPSEYQAIPDLDANADNVGIKTLKLEIEGWAKAT